MSEVRAADSSAFETFQRAAGLIEAGRAAEALPLLQGLARAAPAHPDIRRLLGIAKRAGGDEAGAEADLKAALSLSPNSGPTAYALGELLLAQGRAEEVLSLLSPFLAAPKPDLPLIMLEGEALKSLGRSTEALSSFQRAVATASSSAAAQHNLAGVLCDLERFAEAETAARTAFTKGLDAPEAWLVLARSLLGQGRDLEAEAAYRQVLARRGDHIEAHGELAQLIWMRTDDVGAAGGDLDRAIARFPDVQGLRLKKAELLQTGGDLQGAYEAVAPTTRRADCEPMMHVIAARLSLWVDPRRALFHAADGVAALPDQPVALSTLGEAHLAAGEPSLALTIFERLYAEAPLDQHSLGLLATCWRMLDDPRYGELYDYGSLVRSGTIDVPPGWPDLASYLADLVPALERLHRFRTHPVGQSIRHGSQTSQRLTLNQDPVIQAFFQAVDGPIRAYIAALGPGDDPVRSRRTQDYAFNGEWSVRIRESGFHAGHLHPRGWLSSACYISLPSAVEAGGREGWLQFGQPGVPTNPHLDPQHFIKPEPGLLALFPSYMWHGTIPFTGEEARLTIAFDVVPTEGNPR